MKKIISLCMAIIMCFGLVACGNNGDTNIDETHKPEDEITSTTPEENKNEDGRIEISLSNDKILVDGEEASTNSKDSVYVAHDIIYYESGKDFTYGEGEKSDEHSKEEAEKHVVVHITKPGDYVLSGNLSAGQIAVDLGKNSKTDSSAIVNLYLNGVSITNTVAPAIIFYNVYEPFNNVTEENATKDVDTSAAGANVFILDGTVNNITGSHVARIYKPDSVVLNEEKTEVIEEKKLHKYDAAFYSKMTMNINGGDIGNGILNITADNEGLDAEMHLTINGGVINITSENDGINTNEDNVSVTTINGGNVNILVTGATDEGDGIDSNGWVVINGGTLHTEASGKSPDSGIDSDLGNYINGGTVMSSGRVMDVIAGTSQNFAIFNFSTIQREGVYELKDESGKIIISYNAKNSFKFLLISSPDMKEGEYTLWLGDEKFSGTPSQGEMGPGMRPGNEGTFGEGPNVGDKPENPKDIVDRGDLGDHVDIPMPPGQGYLIPTPPTIPTLPCIPAPNHPGDSDDGDPGIPATPSKPAMDGMVGSGITIPSKEPKNDVNQPILGTFSIVKGANYFIHVTILETDNKAQTLFGEINY